MADLGFLPGVKRILDRTPSRTQRLLFSATLDNGVDVIVKRYLHQPVTHSVDDAAAPPPQMTHHILAVADKDVKRTWCTSSRRAPAGGCCSCGPSTRPRSSPSSSPPRACPPSTCTATSARARASATSPRSRRAVRVLVATDIAARGIHVDDVELVVHVDPPAEHKAYLHRSGRTARAGAEGVVVTVMMPEQAGTSATWCGSPRSTRPPRPCTRATRPCRRSWARRPRSSSRSPCPRPRSSRVAVVGTVVAGTAAVVAVVVAAPAVSSPRRGTRRRARRSRPVRCSGRRRSPGSRARRRSRAGASAPPPTSRRAASADGPLLRCDQPVRRWCRSRRRVNA